MWGTGTINKPLFRIVVNQIGPGAPSTSLHLRHPNRHVSIAQMDELESNLLSWGIRTAQVFQEFHKRKSILILKHPHYYANEGGIDLDPEHDTIASDPDVRSLHSVCKINKRRLGEDIQIHITI